MTTGKATGKLLRRPIVQNGQIHSLAPTDAGWQLLGFAVYRLAIGEEHSFCLPTRETCLIIIAGNADLTIAEERFANLGERDSPFSGNPCAAYVPAKQFCKIIANTELEFALATAPGNASNLPARVISPADVQQQKLGADSNARYVTAIISEYQPAQALLVYEVITPAGNSSSYPPHKNDQDNLPTESRLEEIFYHRINPSQGFAFQRVFSADRRLDEAMAIEDRDLVVVPYGYHPCATCHGYDLYYLNVMAGTQRSWRFTTAPEHHWLTRR